MSYWTAGFDVWDVQGGKMLRVFAGYHDSVNWAEPVGTMIMHVGYGRRYGPVHTCLAYHQIYSIIFDGMHIASGLDTTIPIWRADTS